MILAQIEEWFHPAGSASSAWTKTDDRFALSVTVPANTQAGRTPRRALAVTASGVPPNSVASAV